MNNMYDIINKLNSLVDSPKVEKTTENKSVLNESTKQLSEKYMGWKKTVAAIEKGGSAENPEAVAASIGRKKYGKEKFQKAAAAGKKLGEQQTEESALQAYLGKKKYGEEGMKALQQAGRDGASKEEMASIRAKHDKMDEQQGVAEGEKKPHPKTWHDVDSKLGKQVDKMSQAEKVKKGLAHPDTLKKKGVAEGQLNEKAVSRAQQKFMGMVHAAQKGGRAASPEVAKVAQGMSKKAARDFAATKHKGLPEKIKSKESLESPAELKPENRGEYDQEGDMAESQLRTILDAAAELNSILDTDDNLPEWVQSKITKAMDYLDTARDHMAANPPANSNEKTFLETKKLKESFNRYKTLSKLIKEEFEDELNLDEKDLKDTIGEKLYSELQSVINNEGSMSEELKDMLFSYYKNKGEIPPEIISDNVEIENWIINKVSNIMNNDDIVSENRIIKGRAYGGAAQDPDDDDDDEKPKKAEPEAKRGRGRPRKDTNPVSDSGKAKYGNASDLQRYIVGNVPKKSKSLEKLPTTKHKIKG